MQKIELLLPNEGRKLKNLIMAMLKKGICTEITVLNYAKSYMLTDKKLQKKERKLISFEVADGASEGVIAFIEQVSGRKRTEGDLKLF